MINRQTMSAYRAEVSKHLSPMGQRLFKYVEFDDDEEMIAEIRKHPLGILLISLTGIFIALSSIFGTIILALNLDNISGNIGDGGGALKSVIIGIGLLLGLLSLAFTAISILIYQSNVIFVTNEKIAEVAYLSIFNRKVTQLGIGNVEDVTVSQRGILARLFNFGTILVETAGEIENCTFTLVPQPNIYSQKIIEAHEENTKQYGN